MSYLFNTSQMSNNTSWEVRKVPVVNNFLLCLECAVVVFKLFKMNTPIRTVHFIPGGKWVCF